MIDTATIACRSVISNGAVVQGEYTGPRVEDTAALGGRVSANGAIIQDQVATVTDANTCVVAYGTVVQSDAVVVANTTAHILADNTVVKHHLTTSIITVSDARTCITADRAVVQGQNSKVEDAVASILSRSRNAKNRLFSRSFGSILGQ